MSRSDVAVPIPVAVLPPSRAARAETAAAPDATCQCLIGELPDLPWLFAPGHPPATRHPSSSRHGRHNDFRPQAPDRGNDPVRHAGTLCPLDTRTGRYGRGVHL